MMFCVPKPDMFQNKTNGITHRRFLAQANPAYSRLITETIGDKWMKDANELEKLMAYKEDKAFLEAMDKCKLQNERNVLQNTLWIQVELKLTAIPSLIYRLRDSMLIRDSS